MDWKLLGNCVAALECAFAIACCVWVGVRALRKLPATLLLALALFAVDATLTAQKTNNVPPNMNAPQMMQGGVSQNRGILHGSSTASPMLSVWTIPERFFRVFSFPSRKEI